MIDKAAALDAARPIVAELRRRRQEIGLSQMELAERVGVWQDQIAKWELSAVAPSLLKLTAWAGVLGYDVVLMPQEEP